METTMTANFSSAGAAGVVSVSHIPPYGLRHDYAELCERGGKSYTEAFLRSAKMKLQELQFEIKRMQK